MERSAGAFRLKGGKGTVRSMPLWIPITVFAAFCQNLRSAMQKALKGRLDTLGAAYVRFVYALPFAVLYLGAVWWITGGSLPDWNARFLAWCLAGGVAQILFTVVLLWLFSFRSFAVGTTFSKLEVLLIAGLGALLLGDTVSGWALAAMLIGAVGTVLLATQEAKLTFGGLLRGLSEKATAVGLLCAALLGASVVFFRGAALSLDDGGFVLRAAFTLAVSLAMQTVLMGAWMALSHRDQLKRVFREWRAAAPVGLAGMATSAGWFTAFTLQNAAYVRAVGQVELVFTFLASVFVFRETVTRNEVVAIGLIVLAILLLLLAG